MDGIEAHKAKLDFETMEVECKWEPLDSRVKHIIKRALSVVAPLGRGGVVDEEEDLMAEIEGLAETEGIKLEQENGVTKLEEDD